MKIRNGFVSNSSSSSFIITNKSNRPLDLVAFVEENPQLVKKFNEEYDWHDYTQDEMLNCACGRNEIFEVGENIVSYGDDDGDVLGTVFDYILRDGGESKNFSWEFYESLR